jgi:hypothetical protein
MRSAAPIWLHESDRAAEHEARSPPVDASSASKTSARRLNCRFAAEKAGSDAENALARHRSAPAIRIPAPGSSGSLPARSRGPRARRCAAELYRAIEAITEAAAALRPFRLMISIPPARPAPSPIARSERWSRMGNSPFEKLLGLRQQFHSGDGHVSATKESRPAPHGLGPPPSRPSSALITGRYEAGGCWSMLSSLKAARTGS